MVTAVDTNILLDVLLPNKAFVDASRSALEQAASLGVVVICDVVYAEPCAQFDERAQCDAFLESASISVESLGRTALFAASRSFTKYRSQGGKCERLLPDFFVGAHAEHQASRLISRDNRLFQKLLPVASAGSTGLIG